MAITQVKIFPPIGIARLGNSPDEFFIGPVSPGIRTVPDGGYKDAHCQVKRQAAQFRLFGFDAGGSLVQEITAADAAISWTVHLANKKASYREFVGLSPSGADRNAGIADRSSLSIDPGPRTLTGPDQEAAFNTGSFLGAAVPLGEMRTDADGRLLVVGGRGHSASVPAGEPLLDYANNDFWHDDVSDGPVTATVTLTGGATFTASPSWVLCAPPDFAPGIDSVTTLYDTLFQVAVDNTWLSVPAGPSFTADVFPILDRVQRLRYVTSLGAAAHQNLTSAFPPASAAIRQAVFGRLRDPMNVTQPGSANMPKLWDDSNAGFLAVTRAQYEIMRRWKDGTFTDDWAGSAPAPSGAVTPDGMTRAALEAACGAAFFPGIEASWFLRDTYTYTEPFRLNQTMLTAGDVTKQMAVPWQADFYECRRSNGLAWWPAQRPDDVIPEGGGPAVKWVRGLMSGGDLVDDEQSHLDMVGSWYRLGFVVPAAGEYRESQRQVVCKSITLVTDRSAFGRDEVDAALLGGPPAIFDAALYVIAEGYLPSELGIVAANPTPAQLVPIAPTVALRRPDASTVPDMSATPTALLLEDPSLPATLRQRCTFVYRIEFSGTAAFLVDGVEPEVQQITATASKLGNDSSGLLHLTHRPNPYLVDGPTSWLSTDLRVFQITEGTSRFGVPMGTDGPGFIAAVLQAFNGAGGGAHPFDTISTDQNASRLELSEKVGGKRVFNFAVARVRYRGTTLDAAGVRTSFRLFTTAATGMDYDATSTYRSTAGPDPIALLGLQGGEVVTIPCYAAGRTDTSTAALTTQTDPLNNRTIVHAATGTEVQAYFGCFLDINQTATWFPNNPAPADGPWPLGRRSVQELIRGLHQCLVAEVRVDGDPIPPGATPAGDEDLAQRNLAIVESDNPGSLATHTVQHTFEIKTTIADAAETFERPGSAVLRKMRGKGPGREELMIRWHDLPRRSEVLLTIPGIGADAILRMRGQRFEAERLERVDEHTIRCLPGDVTYIPLPPRRGANSAALLSIALPDGVRHGQAFHVDVCQIAHTPQRVLGTFRLAIPVSDKALLLRPETRALSVLGHIATTIPPDSDWRIVFDRYLAHIRERVRGFGGDPDAVLPSPSGGEDAVPGDEPSPAGECRPEPCRPTGAPATGGAFGLMPPLGDSAVEGSIRLRVRFRHR